MSEVVNVNTTETMHRFEDLPLGQYFWYGCNTRYKFLWCKIAEDGRSILCYANTRVMLPFDVPREDGINKFERTHGQLIYSRTAMHRWLNGEPLTEYEKNNWVNNYSRYTCAPNSFALSFLNVFTNEEKDTLQTMHLELEIPKGYTRRYGKKVEFDAKVAIPDVRELYENGQELLTNQGVLTDQESTASVEPCNYEACTQVANDSSYASSNIFSDGSMMELMFRNANQIGYTRTSSRNNNRATLLGPGKPDKIRAIHPIIKIDPNMEFADITDTYENYSYPQALAKTRTHLDENGLLVKERNTVMLSACFVRNFHDASKYVDSIIL